MRPLRPYDDGEFEALHRPGTMLLSASLVPGLFGQLPWASRYAIAAHLKGLHPLPEPSHARIRAGRYLERAALELLAEEVAEPVEPCRAYARHDDLPLIASPDGLAGKERDAIVEAKVVTPLKARQEWGDGPPLRVQLQHQAQYLATGASRGFIVALIVGDHDFRPLVFGTAPHLGAIGRLMREIGTFMDDLARGVLPDPAPELDHDTTIKALEAIFAPEDGKVIQLPGSDAAERFLRWQEAKATKKAAEAAEDQERRWFTLMLGDASEARIGNSYKLLRREVQVKEHVRKASTSTRWFLSDMAAGEG